LCWGREIAGKIFDFINQLCREVSRAWQLQRRMGTNLTPPRINNAQVVVMVARLLLQLCNLYLQKGLLTLVLAHLPVDEVLLHIL
jgi:hypothetical protein